MPCGIFMVIPVVSTRGFCFQSGFLSRDRAGRSETGYIKLSTPGRTGGCMGRSSGDKDLVVDESGCCGKLSRNDINRETICHPLFFPLSWYSYCYLLLLYFQECFPNRFCMSHRHITYTPTKL